MMHKTQAQSTGEYIMLLTIIVAVGMSMFPLIKRGAQSLIKGGADQIGVQQDAEQDFDERYGYLEGSETVVNSQVENATTYGANIVTMTVNETVNMTTHGVSKMGFTEL